jgi:hypothetical protein
MTDKQSKETLNKWHNSTNSGMVVGVLIRG